jgi:hypothetical protein
MINSLREWLDKPIPEDEEGCMNMLKELANLSQQVGQMKLIAELAEADFLDGEEPSSSNSIYTAAYNAAKQYHSINVEVVE